MSFENRKIPEGINVSQEHPLKEFVQLGVGIVLAVAAIVLTLHFLMGFLVRFLPFEYEKSMVKHLDILQVTPSSQQKKLQLLADELVPLMDLPDGMSITVHYSDDPTVNAFATIGGHVFMFKGLLEKMPSEDALAMVMAHEIAHVKHRHPIVAMGKGITLLAITYATVGASSSSAGQSIIGHSMNLGLLKFSRDQERESDDTALLALQRRYDNVKGAQQLFNIFAQAQSNQILPPAILSTHPESQDRWRRLKTVAETNGWNLDGETIPLALPLE